MPSTSETPSVVITLTEAAKLLGIHRTTAYELVARGEFPVPARRVGKQWRINRAELDRFLGNVAV